MLRNSKENAEMIYKDYGISCVLLNPININTVEIIGMDGKELRINFSLSEQVESNEEFLYNGSKIPFSYTSRY